MERSDLCVAPSSAALGRLSHAAARKVIEEIDTEGRPELYALAEDYLRLYRTVEALLPIHGCRTVNEAVAAFGETT